MAGARSKPGWVLTSTAALFALQATQSAAKPFLTGQDVGFMLLGNRLDGPVELAVAWIHAVLMLVLAYGIWRMRRYALWFLVVYTPYILLNLVLYSVRYEFPSSGALPGPVFAAIYAAIALGVPGGTAYLLTRRREELS